MPVSAAIRQTVLLQPPTRVLQMTLSAGVCTDAERILGLTGDGKPLGSGFGVFPAVTNLLANTNGDVNTTGLTDHSSTTTAVANASAKFNGRAFNVVSGNATANEGPSEAITGGAAATQYTVGGWAWLVSGAATVRAVLSDSVAGKQGSTGVVLTAIPQLISVTATTGAASNTFAAYMETTVQQAGTWRFGGWQVTASPLALPYAPNGGTRVAGRVQLPVAGLFTATQGGVVSCQTLPYASAGTPTSPRTFDWTTDGTNVLNGAFGGGTGAVGTTSGGAGGGSATASKATSFVAGDAVVAINQWSAAQVASASKGSTFTTATRNGIDVITNTVVDLWNTPSVNRALNGNGRWAITYKGVFTAADSALVATWGATVPTLAQIAQLSPGSKPTCLVPCLSADALLLPAYFDGT